MKNIETILKATELTAEQQKAIAVEINENYKTLADYTKQKEKLETAQKNLAKAQDDIKNIATTFENKTAEEWKAEFDKVTKDWETDKTNRAEAEKAELLNKEFSDDFPALQRQKTSYEIKFHKRFFIIHLKRL